MSEIEQLKAKRYFMLGMLQELLPEQLEKVNAAKAAAKNALAAFEPDIAGIAMSIVVVEKALEMHGEKHASNS